MDDQSLKEIAGSLIKFAVRDLKSNKPEIVLDAALFLASDDLPIWLGVAFDQDSDQLKDHGCRLLTKAGQ